MPANTDERAVRLPVVEATTGLKKSQIYQLLGEGTFPRSVPLTGKARGWLMSELQNWISERAAMRDSGK